MADWESRRVEEALARLEREADAHTALLKQLVKYEGMAVLLLKKLVDSQTPPVYPQPTAIAVKVAP
jgi:hypothetical protein